MEHLSQSVPSYEQNPLGKHIEELKIQRESAPLYPTLIEVATPRFTSTEVSAFAQEVGPFFDVLFPEFSLSGQGATQEADLEAFRRRLENARPGWEKAVDKIGNFMIGAGMLGLGLATDIHRELRDIEIPQVARV